MPRMVYVNPHMFSRSILLGTLFLINACPARAEEGRQLVDRVVAVVNDEAVTQSELDLFLRPLYQQLRQDRVEGAELTRQLNDVRLKLLNQIIEDRLVYQEAVKLGVTVDEAEIDELVNELKTKFPSEAEFEKTMARDGYSLAELRERYRRQIAIRKLHDAEIRSRVVVSPQEVEDYYQNRQSEFAEEERVRARSLTVRKSEEAVKKGLADETAKKKIESFQKRIRAGESFEKLAVEFSEDTRAKDGGLIGWIKQGEMLSSLEGPLFQLKAGGISPVLETPEGYHLFQMEEKKVGRIPPFEEVREKIRNLLFREEAQRRFEEWMNQLKARAYISVR